MVVCLILSIHFAGLEDTDQFPKFSVNISKRNWDARDEKHEAKLYIKCSLHVAPWDWSCWEERHHLMSTQNVKISQSRILRKTQRYHLYHLDFYVLVVRIPPEGKKTVCKRLGIVTGLHEAAGGGAWAQSSCDSCQKRKKKGGIRQISVNTRHVNSKGKHQ